ncbi:MarR family transcriptional regulator [Streptomyces sp. WAC 01325]|uniref:MarR family winged helix-turn-helix transcriptional regulator n=1 Tax=Streptomyces sp. WAC 01325 TaxID=2203202 RepID=UPI000F884094|nr:MarR family winged helix-turn-helix transcriptional regulator [Streptomyces sp. WAC 01325]RSN04559.1 MarR family transcriptional regulator [Streptomyces sp. WAC 01325]
MESAEIARALAEVAGTVIRSLTDRRGMSFTTASTLGRLEREGPVRLTALAAAEGVAQPSMTQLVQRLESQGLARRVGDPDDGRVSLVAVTDAGREVLAERRREREARLVSLLAALTEDEREALGAAMETALPLVRRMVHEPDRPGDVQR